MQVKIKLSTDEARLRAEYAKTLCLAIAQCHPEDAVQIMAAALDDLRAGDPPMPDPFGRLREDADFWADCAHPAELEAYFASALKRLGTQALGIAARKRLFVAIWHSLSDQDRRAFLARVDSEGRFHGGQMNAA